MIKGKVFASILTIALLFSANNLGATVVSANTSSGYAGAYGTLRGYTYADGRRVPTETRVDNATNLYMHYELRYSNTGALVSTNPAPAFGYTTDLSEDLDLFSWRTKLLANPGYTLYTAHEANGSSGSYVVYTSASSTYTDSLE